MSTPSIICPKCNASLPADAQYCIECGVPVNPVIEQAPAAIGPTVQLPTHPPAPAPVPAPRQRVLPQTAWYDDLTLPLLLITGAAMMILMPRFIPFMLIAIGAVGLLIYFLRDIVARRVIAAVVLTAALIFFLSRRLFWAPLIIALIAVSFFKKRKRHFW